jgi:D-galactonate transporter
LKVVAPQSNSIVQRTRKYEAPSRHPGELLPNEGIYRKIAWRLLPFLMLCYLCAYLDRVNVGFAKLQMAGDLHLSDAVYGLGAGIFFVGYALFGVPSNVLLHKVGARRWIAGILIAWGICSALFALVRTEQQFYLLRLLLGIAEAGLAPGVLLYLTYWFPSHRRARMTSLWFTAIPLSGIVGGPLSGWVIDQCSGALGWAGWRWMFLIEAVPSIILGLFAVAVLDSRVDDAQWLTDSERAAIRQDLDRDDQFKHRHKSVRVFLRDRQLWLLACVYFCVVVAQYAITFWLPTLIRHSGVSSLVTIGILSTLPYVCAIVAMVIIGHSGDRHRERRWHLAAPLLAGSLGLVLATLYSGSLITALSGLCIAGAGVLAATSAFWMLPTNILGGMSAAAGIAVINSVANLGGFISPYLIGLITTHTGSSALGMYFIAFLATIGSLLVFRIPATLVNR